jgi:hypothetical protein
MLVLSWFGGLWEAGINRWGFTTSLIGLTWVGVDGGVHSICFVFGCRCGQYPPDGAPDS